MTLQERIAKVRQEREQPRQPLWVARNVRKDAPRVAVKELAR